MKKKNEYSREQIAQIKEEMCSFYDNCYDCPLNEYHCGGDLPVDDYVEVLIAWKEDALSSVLLKQGAEEIMRGARKLSTLCKHFRHCAGCPLKELYDTTSVCPAQQYDATNELFGIALAELVKYEM